MTSQHHCRRSGDRYACSAQHAACTPATACVWETHLRARRDAPGVADDGWCRAEVPIQVGPRQDPMVGSCPLGRPPALALRTCGAAASGCGATPPRRRGTRAARTPAATRTVCARAPACSRCATAAAAAACCGRLLLLSPARHAPARSRDGRDRAAAAAKRRAASLICRRERGGIAAGVSTSASRRHRSAPRRRRRAALLGAAAHRLRGRADGLVPGAAGAHRRDPA